jgi:hypothetical protein
MANEVGQQRGVVCGRVDAKAGQCYPAPGCLIEIDLLPARERQQPAHAHIIARSRNSITRACHIHKGTYVEARAGRAPGLFVVTGALLLLSWSARTFASHQMKDPTELAVGVSSAGFEFDCGRRRQLL